MMQENINRGGQASPQSQEETGVDVKKERRELEVKLLMKRYGVHNVEYSSVLGQVKIRDFPLPSGLNRQHTNVLIQFPPGYGYYDRNGMGPPIDEVYVDPGLKFVRDGKEVPIKHYFKNQTMNDRNSHLLKKGWAWVCLYSKRRKWSRRENVTILLQQLWLFFSNPRTLEIR